jgi:hypothetical protein
MIDRARKKLDAHAARSKVAIGGGCAVLFGLPFFGVGLFLLVVAFGGIPTKAGGGDPPLLLLLLVAIVFGGPGLFLIGHGVGMLRKKWRWKASRKDHPGEPWTWDHQWDQAGASHGGAAETLGGFVVVLFLTAFMAPFNYVFLWMEFTPIAVLVIGIFDLITLVAWGAFLYSVVQRLKYGTSRFLFSTFPFFLGESVEGRLVDTPRFQGAAKFAVALRCVEQAFESHGRSNAVVCYSLFEDARSFEPGSLDFGGGEPARFFQLFRKVDAGATLDLSFSLPADCPATTLSAAPPRYWELEVKAETAGVDYTATFLLPVYARPSSSATPAG